MRLTHHADLRRIQRRLPPDVVSTIYDYGSTAHAHGAVCLTLDARSIALASESDRRNRAKLERYQGAYIVVGDGEAVLTVARRRRRFRR